MNGPACRPLAGLALVAALLALTGCATVPNGKPDPRDRFERFNRSVYAFNSALDRAALKPVAKGYVRVIPAPVRHAVGNFFSNLTLPRTIVNDLLQGKFAASGRSTLRFVTNTVIGLGFFDPAAQAGLPYQSEDFGQTLGKWGVHSGPYLMLPILGPSTVRDAFGKIPDIYDNPQQLINDDWVYYGLYVTDAVDTRAQLLDTDSVIERSYDPYAFVRNAWLQRRDFQVHDGAVSKDASDDIELPPDDSGDTPPPGAPDAPDTGTAPMDKAATDTAPVAPSPVP